QATERNLIQSESLSEQTTLGNKILSYPFGAALYRPITNAVDTLLASLQNIFPDKALILDIWATWCGPCINDMKSSKNTKKELGDLPIEVIYLCAEDGSSEKQWKRTVAGLEITGTHIFLNKKLAKSVMKYFGVTAYPSHIYVNKDGAWDANFIHSIANLNVHLLKKRLVQEK
ncbi:MAG: TlpA disulfide reductase family protein, partial [Bacteroidota bacterium]